LKRRLSTSLLPLEIMVGGNWDVLGEVALFKFSFWDVLGDKVALLRFSFPSKIFSPVGLRGSFNECVDIQLILSAESDPIMKSVDDI
jgi:hypothetical protein